MGHAKGDIATGGGSRRRSCMITLGWPLPDEAVPLGGAAFVGVANPGAAVPAMKFEVGKVTRGESVAEI